MLKLIRSELFKLRKRKLFIVLPVLMLLICFGFAILLKGIAAYSDRDWKEDLKKQIATEQEYIESIDQWEWMTEQEREAQKRSSQISIMAMEYQLQEDIQNGDWRYPLIYEYFYNQTLIELLEEGQDPEDYNLSWPGESGTDAISEIRKQNDALIKQIQEEDYQQYNQSQLQALREEYNSVFSSATDEQREIYSVQLEALERYVSCDVPPQAKDNWKSVAIGRIQQNKEYLVRSKYSAQREPSYLTETQKSYNGAREAEVAADEYALANQKISLDLYQIVEEEETFSDYMSVMVSLMPLMVLIGIILGGTMVAGEFSMGTVKSWILYPYKRDKLMASKIITLYLVLIACTLVFFVSAILAGSILFNSSVATPAYLSFTGSGIVSIPFLAFSAMGFGVGLLEALVMGTIALLIGTISRSSALSIGLSLFAALVGPMGVRIFYSAIYPFAPLKFVLFGNFDLMQYVTNTVSAPYATAGQSMLTILAYWTVSVLLCFMTFSRKEIKN